MSQQRYEKNMQALFRSNPLRERFPAQWPTTHRRCDSARTISALRTATATRNEGLLLIGWGDGQAVSLLRQDRNVAGKVVKAVILPDEFESFAHSMGKYDLASLMQPGQLQLCFLSSYDSPGSQVAASFYIDHNSISRMVGDRLTVEHPLADHELEHKRQAMIADISRTLAERLDMLGNDVYDTFLGANQSLMHGRELVDYHRMSDIRDLYKGQTAISIAAGPSASQHLDQIKAIQNEHIIICADCMLEGLLDHGIHPDFVTMVERPENMKRLFIGVPERCQTRLVCPPWVHPHCTNGFQDRVVWWWNPDDLYPWLDPNEPREIAGRSTGTLAVALGGLLGCEKVYLVGHDLCFDNGKTHSDNVHQGALPKNRERTGYNPNYYRRTFLIPGNNGESVETSGIWNIFRSDIAGIIARYKRSGTTFINVNAATGAGAVLEGTEAGLLPGLEEHRSLAKSGIPPAKPRDWDTLRLKALSLISDLEHINSECHKLHDRLTSLGPLDLNNDLTTELAHAMDISSFASKQNGILIRYIFRAAMRNLMVRLQQNTFVRTTAERNWNQVQVMRHYAGSIPKIIDRLLPELRETLEVFQ